jgi:hypothetical protein
LVSHAINVAELSSSCQKPQIIYFSSPKQLILYFMSLASFLVSAQNRQTSKSKVWGS